MIYSYIGLLVGTHNLYYPIMSHLNKRGVLTNYWVLNDDNEIEKAMSTNAMGIMTDRPEHVGRMMKNKAKE